MDPKTIQLIIFAEQMAALLAKTVVDLKNVLSGANSQTVDELLADADKTYQGIITAAQHPLVK